MNKWFGLALMSCAASLLFTGCATTQIATDVDGKYEAFLAAPDTSSLANSGDAEFDTLILVLNNMYRSVAVEVSAYTPAVNGNQDYVGYLKVVEKEMQAGKDMTAAVSSALSRSKSNGAGFVSIKAGNKAVMALNPTRRLVDLATLSKDIATVTPKLVPLASSVFKPDLSIFSKYFTLKDMKGRLAYVTEGSLFLKDQYRIAQVTNKQLSTM